MSLPKLITERLFRVMKPSDFKMYVFTSADVFSYGGPDVIVFSGGKIMKMEYAALSDFKVIDELVHMLDGPEAIEMLNLWLRQKLEAETDT